MAIATRRLPTQVRRERLILVVYAIALGPVRRTTLVAGPQQQRMPLKPFPELGAVGVDIGEWLLPLLVIDDYGRLA